MKAPRIVWILEKRREGSRTWEICWGPWGIICTKEDGEDRAQSFTEQSVGWVFRVRPYKEVV
jgi:hypothetical protein